MTLENLRDKFGNVKLPFAEYSNGTVLYMKELLNGSILVKKIHYGDDALSISFSSDSMKKFSEPEPYETDLSYFPKGNINQGVEFFSV